MTAPGTDGGETVFKGSAKPSERECVLIIDHETGELTLERLSTSLQVKKTRDEKKSGLSLRPSTPSSVASSVVSSSASPKVPCSSSQEDDTPLGVHNTTQISSVCADANMGSLTGSESSSSESSSDSESSSSSDGSESSSSSSDDDDDEAAKKLEGLIRN